MNTSSNPTKVKSNQEAWRVFILLGYVIAFFLYYIDEGNYHFKGLVRPAEWIFVTIYAFVIAGYFQLVFYFLKKINLSFFGKLLLSVVLGLGVLLLIFATAGFWRRIF